jgi:hypothetical protein
MFLLKPTGNTTAQTGRYDLIYYLTPIGLTPGGSSTVNIHTQTVHRTEYTFLKKMESEGGPCPVFASYTLEFALQLRKNHGRTSFRVAEKCPDIPVAAVQHTFTHKQYTKKHSETEYTERYITIRIH